MYKIIKLSIILLMFLSFNLIVNAKTIIKLDSLEYNNTKIKEYNDLDLLINDYKKNKLPDVYITNFLFDGVSSVKDIDLDDFIKNKSKKNQELKIKVLNINEIGDYELNGNYVGMIGINTNNKKGDINIILNNVNIDSDSKKAPAIYVYNKNSNYIDCKVTIKTILNTKNYIEGGRLKKISLIPSNELDKYEEYYTKDNLDNYRNYPDYYGIYTNNELKDILFATVEADKEGLKDGDPYYFYKASGVISSDIDLSFDGEGYLSVVSKNNEGIESKGNLIFTGGKGDYEIIAYEDALNTTSEPKEGKEVRNDLVIDVNSLVAKISLDAKSGDAIDSNGKLIINGGHIYALAHPTTNDSGLDSVLGIYINGGTIIATGNKEDKINDESKQKNIYVTFDDKIKENTLLAIKDENDNVLMAYKTDRSFKNILYSSPELKYKYFKIYSDGEIIGHENNGLYDEITNYKDGKVIYHSDKSDNNTDSTIMIYIVVLVIVLLMFIVSNFVKAKKEEKEK